MKYKLKKHDILIIVALILVTSIVFLKLGILPTSPPKPNPPSINFEKDEENNKLIVRSVSAVIKWSDVRIEGKCNKSGLSTYVAKNDEITDCEGLIKIAHIKTNTLYGTWTFVEKEVFPAVFPYSPTSPPRGTTPEDEGSHFQKIGINREWWYYTVLFDKNSELADWTISISFNHMARNDFLLTNPDMLVVTIHGPNGEEYGGILNKQRGAGIIWEPALKVKSSDEKIVINFEDTSWVDGMYPKWKIHIDNDEIDENHNILIDLDFFSPNRAIWVCNSKIFNVDKSKIASYMFTGCTVTGTVKIDGKEYDVKGIGHHEHSWSTIMLKPIIKGWDWCHITLDNGWNIYYNNYYPTSQIISSLTYKINPLNNIIITTDKGKTLTLLGDVEITIEESEKVSLLLNRPTQIKINAKPGIAQPLLTTYNIILNLNLKFDDTIEKKFGVLDPVFMNIGRSTADGKITWTDDDGYHEVNLNGIGSTWTMRH